MFWVTFDHLKLNRLNVLTYPFNVLRTLQKLTLGHQDLNFYPKSSWRSARRASVNEVPKGLSWPSSLKRIRIKFKSILNLDLSENKNRHFWTNSLFHSKTWTCQTKIVNFGQICFSLRIPGPVRQKSSFSDKFTFPFLYLDLSDKNRQFRTNSFFHFYTWTCQTKIVNFRQSHFSHSIPGPIRQKSSFSDKFSFPFLYLDLSDKSFVNFGQSHFFLRVNPSFGSSGSLAQPFSQTSIS